MIWFLAACALGPLVWAKATGRRKLTPLVLFCLAQFGGLAVAMAKLMPAMSDFTPLTWAVYWGMNLSFIGGYLLSSAKLPIDMAEDPPEGLSPRQILFILAMAVLFFGSVAYSRLSLGVWPLFAKHVDSIRGQFFGLNKFVNFAIQFSYPAAALLAFGLYRRKAPRLLFAVLWALIPLTFILCSARNMILFSLFCILFVREAVKGPVRIRWAALVVAGFVAIFAATSFVRGGGQFFSIAGKSNQRGLLAGMVIVPAYAYISNNFWNLDFAVNRMGTPLGQPTTFGYVSLSGLSYYLSQNLRVEETWHIDGLQNQYSSKQTGLNTISYQWTLYRDFGLALGCGVCFLVGAWCSRAYRAALAHPTAWRVYLGIFASFWAGYSPFIFAPSAPQNVIYLLLAPMVFLTFRPRAASTGSPARTA